MDEMIPVESSNISEVGYDPERAELQVRFKRSPKIYVYQGVPREVFDRIMASPSKGGFVNQEIKSVYPFHIA